MTQLDITTVIAVVGVALSLVSLFLTMRRDRAAGRVGVRMVVSTGEDPYYGDHRGELRVTLSNPERRTITVQDAGLTLGRFRQRREPFPGWDWVGQPFRKLPLTFEPGDPAIAITTRLFRARAALWPDVPRWVWCEDSNGRVYWARIAERDRGVIRAVRPRKRVSTDNDYGTVDTRYVEVAAGEAVNAADLDTNASS